MCAQRGEVVLVVCRNPVTISIGTLAVQLLNPDMTLLKSLPYNARPAANSAARSLRARTLNATGQHRVTLSLRLENLRAARGSPQEERGLKSAPQNDTRRPS